MVNELLDSALRYAAKGWRVFPAHGVRDGKCSCGYDCSSPAKHPRTTKGLLEATTDSDILTAWWTFWPDANVAIATGNGLVVLDVDTHKADGFTSLTEFAELPPTASVVTGGGGQHYYFAGEAQIGRAHV